MKDKIEDDDLCFISDTKKLTLTNEELIRHVKEKFGIKLSLIEAKRWGKFRTGAGPYIIHSPNFTIEKYILQCKKRRGESL